MPREELTFEWAETADAVHVRLPAPPPEPLAMSWTTAVLAAAAALPLPVTVILLWRAIVEMPVAQTFWGAFMAAMVVHGSLLWAAIARLRSEARAPVIPPEPSVLSITDNELKIERAGRDRDMDYSWELSEIADIRVCNAAPDRVFFTPISLLAHAVSHDEVIRVSVECPSGEVDDVMIFSAGRHWTDVLEAKLRAYLGLSPVATRSRRS